MLLAGSVVWPGGELGISYAPSAEVVEPSALPGWLVLTIGRQVLTVVSSISLLIFI